MAEVVRSLVHFAQSAFVEMIHSLAVIHAPDNYGVLPPWMVRIKEKTTPDVQEGIARYGEVPGWDAIRNLALNDPGARDLSVPAVVDRLDGQDVGLARFLRGFWTDVFSEEYYWIEPLLVRSVNEQALRLSKSGVAGYLAGLIPESARRGASVLLDTDAGLLDITSVPKVVLVPTLFECPRVLYHLPEEVVYLSYQAGATTARRSDITPPAQLSLLLKALGDETRLKILKLMVEKRRCTQELALELGLSEPTISRHLKLLREVVLVSGEKEGNYIHYSLRLERIAELETKLLDFFRA